MAKVTLIPPINKVVLVMTEQEARYILRFLDVNKDRAHPDGGAGDALREALDV